jgi:hypothetical protein
MPEQQALSMRSHHGASRKYPAADSENDRGHRVMRREFVVVLFAVLAAAAAVSVAAAGRVAAAEPRENSAAPVAVQRVAIPATGIRDEAAMVLVGTALIGLAAAVRRAA